MTKFTVTFSAIRIYGPWSDTLEVFAFTHADAIRKARQITGYRWLKATVKMKGVE